MISIKNLASLNKLKNQVSSNIKKGKKYIEENIDVDSIQKNIKEGKNFVQENVIDKVKTKFQEIDISQLVSVSETDCEYDTTHYFIIPDIQNKEEHLLLTHREIPKNIENKKIIKKRVFHLSSEQKLDILKEKFLQTENEKNINKKSISDETSDVLSNVANNIDKSNSMITQGLITAGSFAFLINPVTGVALIAGSFVPNLTGDILSGITKKAAGLLKSNDTDKVSRAEYRSLKELQKIKPQIELSTVLLKIENCLKDENYDPFNDISDNKRYLSLTKKIILPIYEEVLKNENFLTKNKINKNLRNYLDFGL
jgi:hypothetical protein